MQSQADYKCSEHADQFACPDSLIHYSEKFDEYGIIIRDGGNSVSFISFCPWCGAKLPESKRDRWFDELEALGYKDPTEQEIPAKYKCGEWFRA
jgi:hypothetical protein